MLDWSEYPVGYVSMAHGIKGELFIRLQGLEWADSWIEMILYSALGMRKVFSVLDVRPHKDGVIVGCGVRSRTEAETLRGAQVWLARKFLTSLPEANDFYLVELLGFEVWDNKVSLGRVIDFETHSGQDFLIVSRAHSLEKLCLAKQGQKENVSNLTIPFTKPFIKEVLFEQHKVLMSLPEGLF